MILFYSLKYMHFLNILYKYIYVIFKYYYSIWFYYKNLSQVCWNNMIKKRIRLFTSESITCK